MQKLTFATCVVDLQIKTSAQLLLDIHEALDILCSIFIQTHMSLGVDSWRELLQVQMQL